MSTGTCPADLAETSDVFGDAHKGWRSHMEDRLVVEWQPGQLFVGVFDGHGGKEATCYAMDHLFDNIQSIEGFSDDEGVKKTISEGFLQTHEDMWAIRCKQFCSFEFPVVNKHQRASGIHNCTIMANFLS